MNHSPAEKAEMRGQNGAAGEVIDLLAQKTNSHPLGALVSPEVRMDQNLGNTMVFGGNTMVFDGNTMVFDGNTMVFGWKYHGFWWKFHGFVDGFLTYFGVTIFPTCPIPIKNS